MRFFAAKECPQNRRRLSRRPRKHTVLPDPYSLIWAGPWAKYTESDHAEEKGEG